MRIAVYNDMFVIVRGRKCRSFFSFFVAASGGGEKE